MHSGSIRFVACGFKKVFFIVLTVIIVAASGGC